MPTYEYRCPNGHSFEVFRKMSDPPESNCPECGDGAERVISAGAGFVLKGEGFYATDYRSEDYKQKARIEEPGDDPASGTAGGKRESKADKPTAEKKEGGEAEPKAKPKELNGE